ncbi:MAG: VCBS repeat-containing protein [Candidatus Helarchaeota archaeon]|nr:VCBS repeat-containing protein [Candidatus Helarchaeota archaeon]
MKKNKLKYILFMQIFIISTIFLVNSLYTYPFIDISLSKSHFNDFDLNTSNWCNITVISDDITKWNDGMSEIPSIAIDNNSVIHVVWQDDTNGEWGTDMEIMYTNYNISTGWSNATVISDDSTGWNNDTSYIPDIAADNNGNLHVVWMDYTKGEWGTDSEIMYTNYTAAGWSNATVISDDYTGWNNGSSQSPRIITDKNGNIHVVWTDYTVGEWGGGFLDSEIMYANYSAAGWSNATVISDDYTGWNDERSDSPEIATDNNSNIHVVWWDDTNGEWGTDSEIMYANYTAAGWSNATLISDIYGWNDDNSWNPSIAMDNNGNIHVAWLDYTDGEWGTDSEIMYTNYTVAGWSNATVISDDYTGWNDGTSTQTSISTDNDGNIHVVWEDATNGEWGTDTEIMYTNYNTSTGWSNATVISDIYGWNDGQSFNPRIAIDKNGNIHAVWQDFTPGEWGTDVEIMYIRTPISAIPISNHPENIITLISDSETINWTLFDDLGSGQYRVWANDTNNNYYIWVDWNTWFNATSLNIPINRTTPGTFNYTIEYNDIELQFGNSDTVIITIISIDGLMTGWPVKTGTDLSSPVIGDIDDDGKLEIMIGSDDNYIWALNHDGTNVTGWPVLTGDNVSSSPALGDIDGDGDLEIVVGSADNGIWVLNSTGHNMTGWPVATGGSIGSSPALGDLDGDGLLEIVVGSNDNHIWALNSTGHNVTGWPVMTAGNVISSPALGDIDNDAQLEIIFGSNDSKIWALNHDGTNVTGWPVTTGSLVTSSPAIGDIDSDGRLEIVVGSWDTKVWALNHDGTNLTGWPITTGSGMASSPALGDIDDDGQLEIMIGSVNGYIWALNHDGTNVTGWPVMTGGPIFSSPAIGNIDIDGKLEVVIGSDDNYTWALNHDGTNVEGWPVRMKDIIRSSPAIGDIDDDGLVEVVIASWDGYIWVINCPSSYDISHFPWPMFNQDEHHSSLYPQPTSNHPVDITTSQSGSELIQWRLYDELGGGGQYRVSVNDTNDNYYIWVDWAPWTNNTPIYIPINRTAIGIFNYTIEFILNTGPASSDTVIVNITGWQDQAPTSNHPQNIVTSGTGSETIGWILYDDIGPSYYRVWVNDTNDTYYVLVDWTTWTDGVLLNVPINYTALGFYNYTIEYNDSNNQFGVPDTVYVTIIDSIPTCNQPGDVTTTLNGNESIQWILYDDFGPSQYRVWVNGTLYHDWTPWINNTPIIVAIIRSTTGTYNYTIEFNSSTSQFASDTVYVIITGFQQSPEQPNYIIGPQGGGDISDLLLSPLGLGIIIGIIAAFSIMAAILIKNNKTIKEINEKISKSQVFKTRAEEIKEGTKTDLP